MILDAGCAESSSVAGLYPGGGNNDAAGLWHAASIAMESRRSAKLLVMISDGLPTECSTEALENLVVKLGRNYRICCAQVAVRPLEVVCFPNYVELANEGNLDLTVQRFGDVITGLVRKTLADRAGACVGDGTAGHGLQSRPTSSSP